MDYDPARITYEELLDVFWCSHDPSLGYGQYRSVIFFHNEAQQTAALASLAREQDRLGRKIQVAVIPYTVFYLAEDYHQKYRLRANSILFSDISRFYADSVDLTNSTAAARLNGYIAGFGDEDTVQSQLDDLGLSAAGRRELLKIIERGLDRVCPVLK